jgi:branched-chain amino acid transport system substrate-binding protein
VGINSLIVRGDLNLTKRAFKIAVLATALALLVAACGSDKKSSSESSGSSTTAASSSGKGNTASAPGVTEDEITIGFVGSLTGVAAPLFKGIDKAFQARIAAENDKGGVNGRKIKVVVEDDTSSPNGNLTAVQKLVQQTKPFLVANVSPFAFASYRYLLQQKVPMVSGGFDGPQYSEPGAEWLLPLSGNIGPNYPGSTLSGDFLKKLGVKKGAGLGYGVSPSSSRAAQNFAKATLPAVGLAEGYVNTTLPFGGENVGPVVLDLKKEGVDAVYLAMDANTNFAVANGLEQAGIPMKAILMATGYGQDLLDQPTTLATAEKGPLFMQAPQIPVELNTPATKREQEILKKYMGYDGVPGFNHFEGYGTAELIIDGLKKGPQNPTRKDLVDTVRKWDNYNINGLTCSGADFRYSTYGKLDTNKTSCAYIMKVENGKFVVAAKTTGHPVAGKSSG